MSELGHDGVEGRFVLLQERAKLPVLVQECLVLDDELCVCALQLGLESLWGRISDALEIRNTIPLDMSTEIRLSANPELQCSAWSCGE